MRKEKNSRMDTSMVNIDGTERRIKENWEEYVAMISPRRQKNVLIRSMAIILPG